MFWLASKEDLILNGSSVHAGLRTWLSPLGWGDYDDNDRQGFLRMSSDNIDDMGAQGVIKVILARIGLDMPTYLSFDIDVVDPGLVSFATILFPLLHHPSCFIIPLLLPRTPPKTNRTPKNPRYQHPPTSPLNQPERDSDHARARAAQRRRC